MAIDLGRHHKFQQTHIGGGTTDSTNGSAAIFRQSPLRRMVDSSGPAADLRTSAEHIWRCNSRSDEQHELQQTTIPRQQPRNPATHIYKTRPYLHLHDTANVATRTPAVAQQHSGDERPQRTAEQKQQTAVELDDADIGLTINKHTRLTSANLR